MMFETEVRDVIAEREQEMIITVMSRAKKLARFSDQIDQAGLDFSGHGERSFAIGSEINFVMNRFAGRSDVDGAIVFAGDYRRIHQALERHRLEGSLISRLIRDGERSAEFPSVREDKFRFIGELIGCGSSGIQHILVPADNVELGCG